MRYLAHCIPLLCAAQGTGKEYIGDDITEIADVVKKALMSCGAQLRSKLNIRASHRERDQKRKALLKVGCSFRKRFTPLPRASTYQT